MSARLCAVLALGVCAGVTGAHAQAGGTSSSSGGAVALPPLRERPAVLVDRVQGAGLLLPSVQETIKAVVMGLNARYGVGFVALEDELHNTRQLRRMSRGMKLPEQAEAAQVARMALLEWAIQEAPFRIRITFKHDSRRKVYVAAAACRRKEDKTPIHAVEGTGKTYDSAVEDLKKSLPTFCGILDGVVAERQRGRPAPAPAPTPAPAPAH